MATGGSTPEQDADEVLLELVDTRRGARPRCRPPANDAGGEALVRLVAERVLRGLRDGVRGQIHLRAGGSPVVGNQHRSCVC